MGSSPPRSSLPEPEVGSPVPAPTPSPPSPAARDDGGTVAADALQQLPSDAASGVAMSPRKKAARAGPKAKGKKKIVVRRPAKKSTWTADTIMTDPRSPLATADLRSILSNPAAWDLLDPSSRAEILALFPGGGEHILGDPDDPDPDARRPDIPTLRNDDSFRHDCAAYTENLAEGRFDPEWLACAWAAHERRKAGDFDEHLVAKFEEDWQIALPEEYRPKRAAVTSKVEDDEKPPKAVRAQEEEVDEKIGGAQASTGQSPDQTSREDPLASATNATTAPKGKNKGEGGLDVKEPHTQTHSEGKEEEHLEDEDTMAVDELQQDEGFNTNRLRSTPQTKKRCRQMMRHEIESDDELI